MSDEVIFFGSIDRKDKKDPASQVTSHIPAWMHEFQMDEMRESIGRQEREIARGAIPADQAAILKENVKREKARLFLIESSRPKLTGAQKDELYKTYQKLGKEIQEYLFTRSDMQMGLASPHEEASRMGDKRVSLERVGMSPELAASLNLRHERGHVSRNDLQKAYKIIGAAIGEDGNPERLRKDQVTHRTSTGKPVGRPRKS